MVTDFHADTIRVLKNFDYLIVFKNTSHSHFTLLEITLWPTVTKWKYPFVILHSEHLTTKQLYFLCRSITFHKCYPIDSIVVHKSISFSTLEFNKYAVIIPLSTSISWSSWLSIPNMYFQRTKLAVTSAPTGKYVWCLSKQIYFSLFLFGFQTYRHNKFID